MYKHSSRHPAGTVHLGVQRVKALKKKKAKWSWIAMEEVSSDAERAQEPRRCLRAPLSPAIALACCTPGKAPLHHISQGGASVAQRAITLLEESGSSRGPKGGQGFRRHRSAPLPFSTLPTLPRDTTRPLWESADGLRECRPWLTAPRASYW